MQTIEQTNKQIYEQIEILNTHLKNEEIDIDFLESHASHLLELIRSVREAAAGNSARNRPFEHLEHSQNCA